VNLEGALVLSVNVSSAQTIQYRGNWMQTGIFKTPVEGPVLLADAHLRGDVQADLKVHGGIERAAYAYAEEDYRWWQDRLGMTLPFGKFGENFTLRGIDVNGALVGERWQIGRAVVQVSSPRVPCYKLGIAMKDQKFVKRFAEALRPGAYLRIIQEGEVAAGDPVEVIWKPDHELTLKEMMRIYMFERDKLGHMLVPELPEGWREWVLAETGT
jgi:MOSC domain-containing protein YiiM